MAAPLFTLAEVESALPVVRAAVPPTPQYAWPQLAGRTGAEAFVKHENHTPIGAFKVRGGLVYVDRLRRRHSKVRGIVSATRGNHGQSLAFAARRAGIAVVIVVPRGNSAEKNAAMRAFGAELIEIGRDFDEAKEHAAAIARQRGYVFTPPFHRDLVVGVATYAHEFFAAVGNLDTVYVPIGLGSGICGVIGMRDALGLATRVVGVVAHNANAYARSFAAGHVVTTDTAHTFADGLAVRVPDATALAVIRGGAERIVEISESELVEAIGIYFSDTHTLTEGAGAAPLAALIKERARMQGRRVGLIMTGQNIDRAVMLNVLAGRVPDRSHGVTERLTV
ncbi:MAG TPA: threonine dehydratase [Xanthobacteraceae bacterium]|nr:threonine dehydratase [Xanthobacteraceae bacterium]